MTASASEAAELPEWVVTRLVRVLCGALPNAIGKLSNMSTVRRLHVKVAGLQRVKDFAGENRSVAGLIDLAKEVESPVVEVNLSTGRKRKDSIDKGGVIQTIKALVGLPADLVEIERIDVTGQTDDDKLTKLQLLDFCMTEKQNVKSENRRINVWMPRDNRFASDDAGTGVHFQRCTVDKKGRLKLPSSRGMPAPVARLARLTPEQLAGLGASPDYATYMQSENWRSRRKPVLARAGGRCERCGVVGPLEVHHKHYDSFGGELPTDLEALCAQCHPLADDERAAESYERLLRRIASSGDEQ